MLIPLFTGFYTSQVVVWDFFHQQYHLWFQIGATTGYRYVLDMTFTLSAAIAFAKLA